jgi:hypothetical protein
MSQRPHLLNDQQMQDFIRQGYLVVNADLPPTFHQSIYQQIDTVFESDGNPGNDILPKVPDMHQVLQHPAVHGALTSVLGADYMLHPHRHCHLNPSKSGGQGFHQDSYEDDENVRQHKCRWAMGLYYPHDVDATLGPSAILPATQFYTDTNLAHAAAEHPLAGKAGTFTLVHYDLWHRATPNLGEAKRYMMKFLFCRMSEPRSPAWNHSGASWQESDGQYPPDNLCDFVWQWNKGQSPQTASQAVSTLDTTALTSGTQVDRLKAAYVLGQSGPQAIPQLMEAMLDESADSLQTNLESSHTNPSQLFSAVALSAQGEAAVPALADALQSQDWWMRAASAAVLGDIGTQAAAAVPALTAILEDGSEWVRRNAAEAIGFIGQGEMAVPGLMAQLANDSWPRTRHNAALALGRLGTKAPGAIDVLRHAQEDENYYTSHLSGAVLKRLAR